MPGLGKNIRPILRQTLGALSLLQLLAPPLQCCNRLQSLFRCELPYGGNLVEDVMHEHSGTLFADLFICVSRVLYL